MTEESRYVERECKLSRDEFVSYYENKDSPYIAQLGACLYGSTVVSPDKLQLDVCLDVLTAMSVSRRLTKPCS